MVSGAVTNEASWEKLKLRLQSFAYRKCRGHGTSVVTMRLALRGDELVAWSEPQVTYYEEPNGGKVSLLDLLTSLG